MKFGSAAHPPDANSAACDIAEVVVKVITGVTMVLTDRLAKGMDMDTAVTEVALVPIVGVFKQTFE
jgi:hypothetical protein